MTEQEHPNISTAILQALVDAGWLVSQRRGAVRPLPRGVDRLPNGRILVYAYSNHHRIRLGRFAETPETVALGGRMAEAARQAADQGEAALRAAAQAVVDDWQPREDRIC